MLFTGIAGSLDFPGFLIRVLSYRCVFRSFLRDLSVGKLFVAGFIIPTYKGHGIVLHWELIFEFVRLGFMLNY